MKSSRFFGCSCIDWSLIFEIEDEIEEEDKAAKFVFIILEWNMDT